MPELSRFFGIVIYMNWRDHPPAHFHAVYGEHEALITLDGKVYSGALPARALSLVREWLALHRDELAQDWELAMARKPLNLIDPLE
ncbi:DUF4160 domain-containing protein [Quatrionicoccus australiensis]|uniref:DUF4160 domain-containing protein n=1 Tax=Quatrionicoccus australiensis TaxID=138118 RepID=UPI001CF8BD6A|nr:DUF4160 domain-containing protein [Quatrionicoccus australiensis]UCV16785.1 DUF4160 domain-containing protein [Quatrionicoccus australiensis]